MSQLTTQRNNGPEAIIPSVLDEIEERFDKIRQRAYELFEARGGEGGHDIDDWLSAERDLFGWSQAEFAEKDDACEIQMTLSGFDPGDVEVTALPKAIVIHAASHHENGQNSAKDGQQQNGWSESETTDLFRSFDLRRPIEIDKVTAHLDHGILHIDVPYAEQGVSGTKRVRVAAA
ncbi:MAG: Hsp20 family protein [Acidobacteriota bacterium]